MTIEDRQNITSDLSNGTKSGLGWFLAPKRWTIVRLSL